MKIDTRKMLLAVLLLLGTVAKYTKTTVDDDLVQIATDAVNNDDLYNLLDSILHSNDVQVFTGEQRTEAIVAALEAGKPKIGDNLDAEKWLKWIEKVPALIRLLLTLAGQRS